MISQIRNGGLLGAVLAASVLATPIVQDVRLSPALEERTPIQLGSYPLSTTHTKDVLVELGAGVGVQVGPLGAAAGAELLIECVDCRTWGNAHVSTAGARKHKGLIGDIFSFFKNPIDAIVSAVDLNIRVDLESVGAHIELDVKAAKGASVSIPLFESELEVGIACGADVDVGLLLAIDLVLSVDAAIDVKAGFEFSLPEGTFLTVNPLTGHIVDKNFAHGALNQLPILLVSGEATIEAALRVRVQTGTSVQVFGTGFNFELGVFVDMCDYTAVVIGTNPKCPLSITESVKLGVGAYALAVVDIDYHHFIAIPAVVTIFLELDLQTHCLPKPPGYHHSYTGYPTATRYPTLPTSKYPTQPTDLPTETIYPTEPTDLPTETIYPTEPTDLPTETIFPTEPTNTGNPTPTLPLPTGYPTLSLPTGYPTLSLPTGYPALPSLSGYPSLPISSGVFYPSGTGSGPSPSNSANGTITASASLTTSTVYATNTYTITSCSATVIHCPASEASEVVVTSTKVLYTTVCPVTETQLPTTPAYPVNTPSPIESAKTLTPVAKPTPSTIYVPTVITPTYAVPTATSYPAGNPGYTVAPTGGAPVYPTYPGGVVPTGGAPAPTGGNGGYPTGSVPSTTAPPFTGGAARNSGTVMFALAAALVGAVALM